MNILDLTDILPRHAGGRQWEKRQPGDISQIIVHQELSDGAVESVNRYHITPGPENHVSSQGAPHICYHLVISGGFGHHADGDIMLTNNLVDIVWHTKGQNDSGIGIMLEGNLRGPDHETGHDPSVRQIDSLIWLIEFLRQFKNYDVKGHCDYGKPACPGYTAMEAIKRFQIIA